MERATLSNLCLPPPVIEAIRDLCIVIAENVSIRDGFFRAGASRLAKRIDDATTAQDDIVLSGDEIELAVDMAEAVVKAIVGGKHLVSSEVLTRICVRVVNPITDALGYVEP